MSNLLFIASVVELKPMSYVWIGVILVALIIEFATTDLVSIWFIPGALIAGVISLFNIEVNLSTILQIIVFIGIGLLLYFLLRPKIILYNKRSTISTNVEAVVGEIGICKKEIAVGSVGEVIIKHELWKAISQDIIEVSDKVKVIKVEGIKLVVRKLESAIIAEKEEK